jgi:glycosyltransferase involved in cell wall biosynthesis
MDVSVIIPAFNAQKTIEYCLNSCLSQIDYIKEIIIVDDHSTDKTIEVAKRIQSDFPDKIFLFENIEKGSNFARNYGFTKATGQFIQWLDADDEIGKDKLKKQVEFLETNPQFDIAYSDWQLKTIREKGKVEIEKKKEIQSKDFITKLFLDKWMPPHAYLLKYSAAKKIHENSGWNLNTLVLQDREYYTIGALLNLKYGYVKNCNVTYYRYPHLYSVSKAKNEERFESLYNLINRCHIFINKEGLLLNRKQQNALYSIEIMTRVILRKPIKKPINLLKINWSVFPGRMVILRTLSNNFLKSK